MLSVRVQVLLAVILAVSACATVPPAPTAIALPGQGKDLAAFQEDDRICRQHAVAHTGYGNPSQVTAAGVPDGSATRTAPGGESTVPLNAGNATTTVAPPVAPSQHEELEYLQCMAARGDTVQMAPANEPAFDYAYPYGAGYPDPYLYDYGYLGFSPAFYGEFYGGLGWGRWHGGRWYGGGGRGGGWHGGGGWREGSWHGGGWHGGGWHGGGGSRGGGGGRGGGGHH